MKKWKIQINCHSEKMWKINEFGKKIIFSKEKRSTKLSVNTNGKQTKINESEN